MTAAPAKTRIPRADALSVAEDLVAELRPACERIEIAGSLRRQMELVGDIELVAIPQFTTAPDLFGGDAPGENALDALCAMLRADGTLGDRLDVNGRAAWGPKFKRTRFAGVPVDLFGVIAPSQFGVIMAIRTGPADYSHQLVTHQGQSFRDATGVRRPGKLPRYMLVHNGQLFVHDAPTVTPEEEDFLEAIGEPYARPWDRK